MSKKILNFENKKHIITECWNYYRLELVLQYKNNMPWFIENFIMMEVYDSYRSYYYEPNSQDWASPNFDEFLEYDDFYDDNKVKDIIISGIQKGGYPILYVDMGCLTGVEINHEILIIGYDLGKQIFKCVILDKAPEFWIIEDFEINQVLKAFDKGKKYVFENIKRNIVLSGLHYPFSVVYIKESNKREVRIHRIYNILNLMLHSCETGVVGERMFAEEDITWQCKYRGVGVYKLYFKKLCDILENEGNTFLQNYRVPILTLKKLEESKIGLKMRVEYLISAGYLKNADIVVNQCEKLKDYVAISLKLLEKYSVTNDNANLVKMSSYLQKAALLEAIILNSLLRKIEKSYQEKNGEIYESS